MSDYYDDNEEEDLSYMSLCFRCGYCEESSCIKYPGMPTRFFGRKIKCKYFIKSEPYKPNICDFYAIERWERGLD